MKAVFVYSNFDFSVKNAGVTRMRYYAQSLANDNTAVYLMTCSSSAINSESLEEIFPNVFILKNNIKTQSFSGTFKFIKNLFKFSKDAAEKSVFLFYPSPLVYLEIIAMYYIKWRKKCRVFYELNEIRKYTATFQPKLSLSKPKYSIKKIVYKTVFSSLERLLKSYNGLICISTSIEEYGQKFNTSTIRIPILTNPDLKKTYSEKNYSVRNSFNIGFSGSIHPTKENLNDFFYVLTELNTLNLNFTLNLCGPIKKEHEDQLLDKKAEALGIKNRINYYGNLNEIELSTFLSQQELLVITRGYTLQNKYGFSTKLSDYLDHSKPILVTDISDNKLFIKDGVNGFIVPPNDNESMLNKLKYIIDNYDAIKDEVCKNANDTSRNSFYYQLYGNDLRTFLFES